MAVESPVGRRHTVTALLMLTVGAGLIDAVSYLSIGHVFIALTTGNLIFLGLSVDPQAHLAPLNSAAALCAFLVGALVGGRCATHLSVRPRRWLAISLAAESCAIAVVAALNGAGVLPMRGTLSFVTIGVLGLAAGIQTATVRHLGSPDLLTTVLTMTMTGIIADSPLAGRRDARVHRRLGSIVCMVAGAGSGALLIRVSAAVPLALAALLTAAAAAVFALCGRQSTPARGSSADRQVSAGAAG